MTDLSEARVSAGRLVLRSGSGREQKTRTLPRAQIPGRRDKGNFTLTGSTVSRINSAYMDAARACET